MQRSVVLFKCYDKKGDNYTIFKALGNFFPIEYLPLNKDFF